MGERGTSSASDASSRAFIGGRSTGCAGRFEPVSAGDFLRMLLRWQRVEEPVSGAPGLHMVVEMLSGFEAPAGVWESDLLGARASSYEPAWLDSLCLSGRLVWGRVGRPTQVRGGSVRSTPIALLPREAFETWQHGSAASDPLAPGGDGGRVAAALEARGPAFFHDLQRATGLLGAQLEQALAELVRQGRVTSDSFVGVRALLHHAKDPHRRRRGRRLGEASIEAAGRWSLLPDTSRSGEASDAHVEAVARGLLRRWGVVMRRLVDREGPLPPWRDLLTVYRRLEARGEIRGGRFVAGLTGEQYALPEAVEMLRAVRRGGGGERSAELVVLSACDPLNLLGILTPDSARPVARVEPHRAPGRVARGGA